MDFVYCVIGLASALSELCQLFSICIEFIATQCELFWVCMQVVEIILNYFESNDWIESLSKVRILFIVYAFDGMQQLYVSA